MSVSICAVRSGNECGCDCSESRRGKSAWKLGGDCRRRFDVVESRVVVKEGRWSVTVKCE